MLMMLTVGNLVAHLLAKLGKAPRGSSPLSADVSHTSDPSQHISNRNWKSSGSPQGQRRQLRRGTPQGRRGNCCNKTQKHTFERKLEIRASEPIGLQAASKTQHASANMRLAAARGTRVRRSPAWARRSSAPN